MKTYQMEIPLPESESLILWIRTEGQIIIPDNSDLTGLKEIEILKNSSGVDLIVRFS